MKKFLAILMLSFLVGFALESCTNDEDLELQKSGTTDIRKDSIKAPPGG